METNEIKNLLAKALPGCDINVEGSGGKYLVTAVGDFFQGLNAVKRQQAIYEILKEHISSGEIHAITMKLQTVVESSTS